MDHSITTSVVQNGFRCGLLPWNADAVDYTKIKSKSHTASTNNDRFITTDPKQSQLVQPVQEWSITLGNLSTIIGNENQTFFEKINDLLEVEEFIESEDKHLFRVWKQIVQHAIQEKTVQLTETSQSSNNNNNNNNASLEMELDD